VFVAGVDGCRSGWVIALRNVRTGALSVHVVATFAAILSLPEAPRVIAVDIPIGLLDAAVAGGRRCDRDARSLLGSPRSRSVFSPPVRAAMHATTHAEASRANRASSPSSIGLSIEAYGILGKVREVDDVITAALQARVREVHPELCFYAITGHPPRYAKKRAAGRAERLRALAAVGFVGLPKRVAHAARDDVIDAAAACWTAQRVHGGLGERLPVGDVPRDSRGLRMEIWR
jgi:predicted RNase H-like nuclease